jgi:hypothetical protein
VSATQRKPGEWFPVYYGNWFRIARLLNDLPRTQAEEPKLYKTLAEARAECERRNKRDE